MYKKMFILITLILMLSFSFADLTTDLVSYYDFDEASGNLLDLTVNSKDLTNSNITYSQTGIIENAYSYNGSTSTSVRTERLVSAYPFTYNVWFKTTATDGELIAIADSTNNTGSSYLRIEAGKPTIGAYVLGGSNYICVNATTKNDGAWHMATAIFKSDTNKLLYVDGVYSCNLITSSAFNGSANRTAFGYLPRLSPAIYFNGNIDEAGIWDRVLTSDEVTELYNSGDGFTYPFSAGECSPTINEDWVISSALDCNSYEINLGTGNLVLSTGAKLRLFDSNIVVNRFDINASGSQLWLGSKSWLKIS